MLAVCIWSGMFCHVLFRRYDCDFAIFHGNACSRLQGSASNPQLVAQTKWKLLANAGELLLATEHGQSTTNISTYFHIFPHLASASEVWQLVKLEAVSWPLLRKWPGETPRRSKEWSCIISGMLTTSRCPHKMTALKNKSKLIYI